MYGNGCFDDATAKVFMTEFGHVPDFLISTFNATVFTRPSAHPDPFDLSTGPECR